MRKPKFLKYPKHTYSWRSCKDYLEQKYQINLRDVMRSHDHFGAWCDAKGYGNYDRRGLSRNSSSIWWTEYRNDESGFRLRPAYQDFWLWVINVFGMDIGKKVISFDDDLIYKCTEEWQIQCLNLFLDEFGHGDTRICLFLID